MVIGEFGESFIPVLDGVARVMKAYAETLTARGNDVYVITPMYDTGYRGNLPYEIVDFLSIKPLHKLPYRIGLKSFDQHFVSRMKHIDLDICHVHGPAFASHIGMKYAKQKNIPIIGSFHTKFYDDILEITKSKPLAKAGSRMVADFYSQCDEVWAVSEGTGETLREYGYKGEIIVMPNGTNRRELNTERVPEVRAKYGIREDKPVLLFVGRLHWNKNLGRIIEACGLLKQKGFDFQLVLAGQGLAEQEVRELAKKCNITENLTLTGYVADVETLDCLYHMADLFVFPSIYDNAPMVLREAAAQKTPALAIEGSCTAEVIQDGVNGILCQDTNESVCDRILSYFAIPEEKRNEMKEAAYKTIPIAWDGPLMDTILERYQNLIDKYKKLK